MKRKIPYLSQETLWYKLCKLLGINKSHWRWIYILTLTMLLVEYRDSLCKENHNSTSLSQCNIFIIEKLVIKLNKFPTLKLFVLSAKPKYKGVKNHP